MKIAKTTYKMIQWMARILAVAILLFGFPFYFGYGNPLPFIDPEYTIWDNTMLSVFPLIFIGLVLGWKWPRLGGWLITITIIFGFVVGIILRLGISFHRLLPFMIGLMYLIKGYAKVTYE